MIGEVLEQFFFAIGVCTTAFIATGILTICIHKFKQFLRNQKRIKWLCRHEYEPAWIFHATKGWRYGFRCRKCGKAFWVQTYGEEKRWKFYETERKQEKREIVVPDKPDQSLQRALDIMEQGIYPRWEETHE